MMFVLRMAWRETRSSAFRLLFFFLCVAIGVAAIVVLRSVMQNVRETLMAEARTFIGADLLVSSSRAWTPDGLALVTGQLQTADVLAVAEVIETRTMAVATEGRGTGIARLVELFTLDEGFPFYGTLELRSGRAYAHALVAGRGVLVAPDLLVELGVEVGDVLRLGGERFVIRDVVVRDRLQRGGGFTFGPRVYVATEDLRATSLLGFGSQATYRFAARVPDERLRIVSASLRRNVPRTVATVRDWRNLEDRLGRNLTVAENYLSLVGFAIVVLGGIGVWSVTRVVVQQKIRSVAVLKCVGATSRQVLTTYVLQVLMLAAGGSLLGVVVAAAAVLAIPDALLEPLGVTAVNVTPSAAVQGMAVGLLVSLLFALAPLLEVRRVKPLLLLRADTASTARRRDWQSASAWLLTGTALVLVAVWQADSVEAGVYVSLGLAVVTAALWLASHVLVRLTRPLARSTRFPLRHAVVSLARPGNQTRVILMAVGLGCFFILSVRAVQANLLAEFDAQIGREQPDLILIDIQPDQAPGTERLLAPYTAGAPRLIPLIRARVAAVDGARVRLRDAEMVRRRSGLTREYGITYRTSLEDNERLVDGVFPDTPATPGELPPGVDTEVSVEIGELEDESLSLGDRITFDAGGQRVTAVVTSVREVAWDDARNGGFVFVLRPSAAVDGLPQNLVGFVVLSAEGTAAGRLQRDLVTAYPNISVIDLREVIATIRELVDNVTLGVTVVGAVTVIGGMLILIGAVAMTKFQRLYEAAIYRTLGAGTRLLAAMVLFEYGLLGTLAGVLGAAGAFGLSWLLARHLFEIVWVPATGLLVGGVGAAAIVVALVGLLASLDVLVRKPLAVLRRE